MAARPRTGETPKYSIRLPDDVRARLEEIAAARGQTLASYMKHVLTRHADEMGGAVEEDQAPYLLKPAKQVMGEASAIFTHYRPMSSDAKQGGEGIEDELFEGPSGKSPGSK